ncbi:MAG TPA: CHAP domain-containing protein [Candidatus Saccharimonadales bacterium]|nr:CHAP domain-containing protein [Candidatus Saccharimonadales bacterium]
MPEKKKTSRKFVAWLRSTPVLVVASLLTVGMAVATPLVRADQYDAQINALQQQNNAAQGNLNNLEAQASSYQDTINKLQSQINAIQAAIADNEAKQAQLQQQIVEDQKQIDYEKTVLANDVKTTYINGQITPVEMLATSSSLSDYIDKQEAYSVVQDKIQATVQQITELQKKLQSQKEQVDQLLATQKNENDQLSAAKAQQDQLLSMNESQQASYNSQISANQSKIAQLRAAQAAANRRLDSSGAVITSGSCGGSYPQTASGSYGPWGCGYVHSSDYTPGCSYMDSWGMCNRECVSYTAWMVYKTYGINTIGFGNANQWPGSARAAHIPTGYTPKVGSVAIYTGGTYGHAMWVVGVSGDQVHVYSYNDGYDGNFYDHWVNGSGLTYIYFGG